MSRRNEFRVVFASGGTGGHLIPAIALAQELLRLYPQTRVRFLTPGKKLERTILDDHGMDYDVIGGSSPSGSLMRKFLSAASLVPATLSARAALKRFSPDVVIGAGGYASVCGGLAAKTLRVPLFLLEQNVIAGRVNRAMSRLAQAVYAQWPLMHALPGRAEVRVMGNPVRRNLGRYDRCMALSLLDLDPERTTLLIMGGSQGASGVNRFINEGIVMIEQYHRRLQVIHISGTAEYDAVRSCWAHSRIRHKVLPFATDMGPIIAGCDIALCRAGATSMSELASFGKPMILIPLPTSADDHQTHNARYAAAYGAAFHLAQSEASAAGKLEELVRDIVLEPQRLAAMAAACPFVARLDAGKRIASDLLDQFGVKPAVIPAEKSRAASSISGRAA